MMGVVVYLALSLWTPPMAHEGNTLFRELQNTGVAVGTATVPLPPPFMADGLTAAGQATALRDLPERHVPTEELVRASVVAPFALRIRDLEATNATTPVRSIDLAFIAYGRLERLISGDFLDQLLNAGRKDANIHALAAADLAARHITPVSNEGSAHVRLALMDRVVLNATNRTVWSRTDESIIVAAKVDPRFSQDATFPNEWRLLERDDGRKLQPIGPGRPYESAGYYLKITRLREPTGALFVEWHLVFAEPVDWFAGANLLRSKLPLVLQTKVRGFRRDLLRQP